MRNHPCLLTIRDMYLFPRGSAVPAMDPLTELLAVGGPVFQSTTSCGAAVPATEPLTELLAVGGPVFQSTPPVGLRCLPQNH